MKSLPLALVGLLLLMSGIALLSAVGGAVSPFRNCCSPAPAPARLDDLLLLAIPGSFSERLLAVMTG